jgi:uncharacterized protein (TIGR02996 family)
VSDGDALLAAILREPADHTSRLVYADWLDERGEPGDAARAEFIRVQCERARIPEPEEITIFRDGGPVCKACQYVRGGSGLCRFHELFQRERELFNCLYADNLPGPFVPNLDGHTGRDGPHAQYRRGFVERVFNCAAADWLTHGDAITAAQPVRLVRFSSAPRDTGHLNAFALWRRMRRGEPWRSMRWRGAEFVMPGEQPSPVVTMAARDHDVYTVTARSAEEAAHASIVPQPGDAEPDGREIVGVRAVEFRGGLFHVYVYYSESRE